MTKINTTTATLPITADALYAFLADLSKHRVFLEPEAMSFEGEADKHHYIIEVMGMKLPQELVVKDRVPGQLVSLVPGSKKIFDHELRYEITALDSESTLRLVDEADIPMMMQVMGVEKLLQGQLDRALARIQELVGNGTLAGAE